MKYYAHYGHRDFVLCLGYHGNVIKDYFLRYEETTSNDFVLTNGGREVRLLGSDIEDWKITFVDTGQHTNVGERLKAVRQHLEGEEFFLANYADGLTDLPLSDYISFAVAKNTTATFLAVRPPLSFHVTTFDPDGYATSISPIRKIIRKIGTIAAVPVTTDENSTRPYVIASVPRIAARESA